MERELFGIKIQCIKGDIVKQKDIEAIVNAANAELMIGGGVAGAIHIAAGPELYEECKPLAPIKPGEAVITQAYRLPNKYVIHCLGPIYGVDEPADIILSNCYENALKLADEIKINSIAFPSISTGIFGYPVEEAVELVSKKVISITKELKNVRLIRFTLYSNHDLQVFIDAFERNL